MKIELEHSEIETALKQYVGSQGINIEGKKIDVHMIAGRGGNGFSASISIVKEKNPVVDVAAKSAVPTFSSGSTEESTDEEPADTKNLFVK